jgi:hypothetical protein
VTPEELEILKAISCQDVETFLPAGPSATQAQAFDELVEVLQRMERLGWIELRFAASRSQLVGRYKRKYRGAVARCTDHGREVLRMLGE